MLRQWFARHRSLAVTATSGTVIAALIAAVAIVSTGYTAQHVDLSDGSVWVPNGSAQVIGRANTQVLALNTVVASTGEQLSVVQRGSTVLSFDQSNSKLDIIDAATSTVTDSVPLPARDPQVMLAGTNVVIASGTTGEVWITPLDQLSRFDAESPATLTLGADSVSAVTPEGMLFSYSTSTRIVSQIDAAHGDSVQKSTPAKIGGATKRVTITAVGSEWALLDAVSRTVRTASGLVRLASLLDAGSSPVLQQPSTSGDDVLVGFAGGLAQVPLGGGAAKSIVSGRAGTAAAPTVVDGCTFAAWGDGSAWRDCGSAESVTQQLESMPSAAPRLAFAVNGDRVVLNDPTGGATWAVQQTGELIDNWADLITVKDDNQQQQENTDDTPPEYEKTQVPPVAVDDSFGARPGRTSVLPVLLNDYDPNGDVIVVTDVAAIDATVGHVDIIDSSQQVQITLLATAHGSVSFHYTISDGRGGSAGADVTVAIRLASENSPPHQVRQSRTSVVAGGRVQTSVLGDWVDPDGDAFYLASASTAAPDTVSYKPEGTVVFTDGGGPSGTRSVTLEMSDGTASGTGSLAVTVKPSGQVPIMCDPFIALAYSGQEITVSPLDHVRGGSAAIRLVSVPTKPGSTITASLGAGTFRFTSTQTGTHYLDFVVTDGDQTTTCLLRVDVASPPDANTKPITTPKVVFVRTLSSETVDIASSDIDPSGGVLLVTGVSNVPAASGVQADVIEQRAIRVTLTKPLESGPVDFNYRVSNGVADAEGTVTVVQIPTPTQLQPPIATDDSVTVRVGDAIDIPVLDNDVQPDGEELTLDPQLTTSLSGDSGLLFASGNVLRYLAPDKTGDFTAAYSVSGPDGQKSQARVKISVREAVAATNNPPVPTTIVARVLAGETVRIAIPLTGIDPDGDSVQFLGQSTNPDRGTVVKTGADFLDYQAGDYSAGTDTFDYTVIDSLGARATGIIRVGIAAKTGGAHNPVAVEDEVTMRPGGSVSVQPLANDSDPDGGTLSIVSVEPTAKDIKAKVVGDIVTVTPPKKPGRYGLVYTIENAFGGTSQNFITVVVAENAPRAYPVVSDSVLTLTDVLGRSSIDVNVLQSAFFADGPVSSLDVSLLPGYQSSASVTSGKRVHVVIGKKSQIIPFAVAHPDDASVVSYAFIWVPGLDDALPQLNRNAPALSIGSESTLTIDLRDYVVAIGGKQVILTDTTSVAATHSNGSSLVVNDHTLRFTSAEKYFGPASVSFTVTDGTSANDPAGHTATLVLSITVTPRQNQPPVFVGASIDFEPAQSKDLDLSKLTNYPYPKDAAELQYTVLSPLPTGFTYTLTGQHLTLRADESAVKDSTTAILLGVKDDLAAGQAGAIQLHVVASSAPLAQPAADSVIAPRGTTVSVDVLANDQATNPFPGKPLSVVAIRGLGNGNIPAGLSVTPSADRQRLSITASASASPGDTTLQYEVADATNDPSRYVWGSVTISLQDKPDPVTGVTFASFRDRSVQISWNAPQANNSPITGYEVTAARGDTGAVVSTVKCAVTSGCDIPTPGNGSANRVTISVVAINSIGSSTPTSLGGAIWSDVIPAAPVALASSPLDHGLRVVWKKPANVSGASAITSYLVTVGGVTQSLSVAAGDDVGTSYSKNVVDPSLANGSTVAISVGSRNDAFTSLADWNSTSGSGIPAGAPIAGGSPSAGASVTDGTTATLSWASIFSGNGRDVTTYYAAAFDGSAPACTVTGVSDGTPTITVPSDGPRFKNMGTATSTTFSGLSPNTTYSFAVYAYNGQGCTMSPVVTATPRSVPGTVTGITRSRLPSPSGSFTWDFTLSAFSIAQGSTDADQFIYRLVGTGVDGSASARVALGATLTTGTSQYGVADLGVQVRACRVYPEGTLCSTDWSSTFRLGTAVSNTALVGTSFTEVAPPVTDPPTAPDPVVGTYSWASSPSGAGYSSVTYSCDNGATQTVLVGGVGGSCSLDQADNGSYLPLTITITANNGTNYVRTYQRTDFP